MDLVRSGATKVGSCACTVNTVVQTRLSKMFFPFNDLDIPPKLRKQAWAFRITYILWSIGQTIMVFYIPNSYLWKNETELNAHAAWTLLLMLVITWIFYFQFQGSNPGYIHAHMLHRFHTVHNTYGVGDNGEGDSFSGYIFRTLTNLGRRAVTNINGIKQKSIGETKTAKGNVGESGDEDDVVGGTFKDKNAARTNSGGYDSDSSSSGEVDCDNASAVESAAAVAFSHGNDTQTLDASEQQIEIHIHENIIKSNDNLSSDHAFIAAETYTGAKEGYYYAKGQYGIGYYLDDDIGKGESHQNQEKPPSGAQRKAQAMARVERYLAGQDKGRAVKVWVPKFDVRKYESYDEGIDDAAKEEGGNCYETSRFITENGEIGLEDQEDGSFQTKMDFADIADDFPLRAHYCRQADRVVPKFDHYCDLLGTPVGERNHSLFWMYLVAQNIILIWGFSIVISGFQGTIIYLPENWLHRNAMVIVNFVLVGVSTLGVLGLLCFQTWCALTDTLTYEFVKSNDLEYLKNFGPCDLPFSKGPCRNFYRFIMIQPGWCTASKDWLPTKYPKPQQFFRDSNNCCLHPWENKYYSCC